MQLCHETILQRHLPEFDLDIAATAFWRHMENLQMQANTTKDSLSRSAYLSVELKRSVALIIIYAWKSCFLMAKPSLAPAYQCYMSGVCVASKVVHDACTYFQQLAPSA